MSKQKAQSFVVESSLVHQKTNYDKIYLELFSLIRNFEVRNKENTNNIN